MAKEYFTQLPTVSNAQLTDIISAVQGYVSPTQLGISVQETLGQVLAMFQSNSFFTYSGDPNGNLAGSVNNFCWDSVDHILWVCTTAGNTSGAVWTPCIGQLGLGQVVVGTGASSSPSALEVTAGTGISITQNASQLTFTATGTFAPSYMNIMGTSATMVVNTGYIANNAGLVTLTLPATAAIGSTLIIVGNGAGGWTIAQNAGQNIQIGSTSSTVGVGGSISSTNRYDSLTLVCTAANNTFVCVGGPQGNLTIV